MPQIVVTNEETQEDVNGDHDSGNEADTTSMNTGTVTKKKKKKKPKSKRGLVYSRNPPFFPIF